MDVEIADGRTEITVTGERDASVVVRSASGERVYLPPERSDDGASRPVGDGQSHYDGPGSDGASSAGEDGPYDGRTGDSPYEGPSEESPYEGIPDDSPYDAADESPTRAELTPTADGFRILHPEPVTDVRLLRPSGD